MTKSASYAAAGLKNVDAGNHWLTALYRLFFYTFFYGFFFYPFACVSFLPFSGSGHRENLCVHRSVPPSLRPWDVFFHSFSLRKQGCYYFTKISYDS